MLNWKERRALALVLWLAVVGWLVSTSTVISLPHSAWRSATDPFVVEDVKRVLPQGWAFFTRDPQEPQIHTYVQAEEEWIAVPYPPGGSARALFGINRKSRLYGHEMGHVASGIPADDWHDCGQVDHFQCLRSLTPVAGLVMDNSFDSPKLCGTVGLVQHEPIPWAWREAADSIQMPLTAAAVEVSCKPE